MIADGDDPGEQRQPDRLRHVGRVQCLPRRHRTVFLDVEGRRPRNAGFVPDLPTRRLSRLGRTNTRR